jgi:hypothetical protein
LPNPQEHSAPMLDVHAPHEAAHSWKDFFIHIATIVVGLLIAVGLEQTVEYVHHSHQRHELLEQLDAEHRQILKDAEDTVANDVLILNWEGDRIEALRGVIDQHRPFQMRPFPALSGSANRPDDPVWQAAKASGLTSLLSQQVVIANTETERLLKELDTQYQQYEQIRATSLAPACRSLPRVPGTSTTDYVHADVHDLRDCLRTSEAYYYVRTNAFDSENYIVGCEKAILAGETDVDRITVREADELKARQGQLR